MGTFRHVLASLLGLCLPAGSVWAQATAPAVASYARLPLAFEKQAGASGDRSGERFVAHGQGYIVGLEKGKASIGVLAKDKSSHTVSLEFAGSRPSLHAVPGAELPGKVNYIRGNDPHKWQLGLPTYARVAYPDAY